MWGIELGSTQIKEKNPRLQYHHFVSTAVSIGNGTVRFVKYKSQIQTQSKDSGLNTYLLHLD